MGKVDPNQLNLFGDTPPRPAKPEPPKPPPPPKRAKPAAPDLTPASPIGRKKNIFVGTCS